MKLRHNLMHIAAAGLLAVALPASAQLLGGAVGGTLNGALGGGGLHGGLAGNGGLHGDLRGATGALRGAKEKTREVADKAREVAGKADAAGKADGKAAISREGFSLDGNVSGDAGLSKPVEASEAASE